MYKAVLCKNSLNPGKITILYAEDAVKDVEGDWLRTAQRLVIIALPGVH